MADKKTIPPAPTWDIESVFPGGADSTEFKAFREKVRSEIDQLTKNVGEVPAAIDASTLDQWVDFVQKVQSTLENIELVVAFAGCLTSQNVDDAKGHTIRAEGDVLYNKKKKVLTLLEAMSLKQSVAQWQMLLDDKRLDEIKFYLKELRDIAASKMAPELETLALDLSVNGFHAWNRLYDKMAGDLKVDFEENGKVKTISLGQMAAKMADPDRAIRAQAFDKMVAAWKTREELAGMTLNAVAGFRLSMYRNRKWESPLYEPLVMARMKQETLDAMWSVIARETPRLQAYVDAKKKLLGIDKYRWYDEFAPCGKADKMYSFEVAGKFICDNTKTFSTDLSEFIKMALEKRWVEAEDRAKKGAGAHCTSLGPLRQTRVFMTYAGTFDNLLTLAHELGHSYHSWVLRKKQYFATDYPMNLAETASIFTESLVTDAALSQAKDPQEKLMLLEQKIQAAYVMFTDLQSRYLFDKAFYKERAQGAVSTKRLSELMIAAQKQAYGSLLDESGYHPLFWCTKLHFYLTDAPFYNFPYAFGYLFAGGVYDRARKEGAAFADKYRDLLADTGSMTTEELAQKHLGVDLTKEDFWKAAVDRSLADIDEFVKLAQTL